MWVFIVINVIIVALIVCKFFDRDFIKITHQNGIRYLVELKNGKKPICELVEKTEYSGSIHYVLIPVEKSLKSIPDEDIIILRSVREAEGKAVCVFADEETDEAICIRIKEKYADQYHFAE